MVFNPRKTEKSQRSWHGHPAHVFTDIGRVPMPQVLLLSLGAVAAATWPVMPVRLGPAACRDPISPTLCSNHEKSLRVAQNCIRSGGRMLQAGSLCSPECRAECATADTSTCCDSLGLMKAFLRAEKVKEQNGAPEFIVCRRSKWRLVTRSRTTRRRRTTAPAAAC